MNRIRRIAEDLVTRYPSLFTSDFDKNKQALSQVSVIRIRSIRNQLAGAITRVVHDQGPATADVAPEPTLGEKIIASVEQETQAPAERPQSPAPVSSPKAEAEPSQEQSAAL